MRQLYVKHIISVIVIKLKKFEIKSFKLIIFKAFSIEFLILVIMILKKV